VSRITSISSAVPATISDEQFAELMSKLPASPRLLSELAPKLEQAEVPLEEVTDLLRRDAALTARIISVANSAAYARAEPATSLEEAVTCIGFREVYRIVGAIAATQLSEVSLTVYGVEAQRFRENALFVALVMEELSAQVGTDPRAAYTVGLLRSIGKVALAALAAEFETPIEAVTADDSLLGWEQAHFGSTNADIAARVLSAWRFPTGTVEAVRDHYQPTGTNALAHLMNIASGAADLRGFGFPGEEAYWQFTPDNFAVAGVDEGTLVWAGERAFRTLTRIVGALG
jgi:HD-like signal output (HDOD) protein